MYSNQYKQLGKIISENTSVNLYFYSIIKQISQ